MTGLRIEVTLKAFPLPSGRGTRTVLKDIDLEIASGEFVCILGPSGCGKTTLLNLVAGLDTNLEGRIDWHHHDGAPPRIGYVFQSPALLPWRTVSENLKLVMSPEQLTGGRDETLLDAMGLSAYRDSYPNTLSLGMSRRVALARAFVVEPDILLMDEPFVSLDEDTANNLRRLLLEAWNERPTTILVVTHDSREAIQLAQRIVILSGSPTTVVGDDAVTLTAEERRDPFHVEALRERIMCPQRYPVVS